MGQDLPVTSYALLGLLTFGDELTGYELKQRADATLRFYWVSPAMSQVYSELARLTERGLVLTRGGGDRSTTYRLSAQGRRALETWMRETEPGFSVLKHPVALRLLLGHVVDPATTIAMLEAHVEALDAERAALVAGARRPARRATRPGSASGTPLSSRTGAWTTSTTSAVSSRPHHTTAGGGGRVTRAIWLVVVGIVSVQVGAAFAKDLFGTISPTAIVWLRLVTSALVLTAIARPRLRGRSRGDWLGRRSASA